MPHPYCSKDERQARLRCVPARIGNFTWCDTSGRGVCLTTHITMDRAHSNRLNCHPKSLPPKPPVPQLRHPKDNTLDSPWEGSACEDMGTMQPIENLVANYGDATNTSWTEDRNRIWRHGETGAPVSWVPVHEHAILPGNPLCDESQYTKVASAFLNWLRKHHSNLKSIWVLEGHEFEEVLGTKFGWKTFTCAAEKRVDATKNVALHDHDVARKTPYRKRRYKDQGV